MSAEGRRKEGKKVELNDPLDLEALKRSEVRVFFLVASEGSLSLLEAYILQKRRCAEFCSAL